MIDKAKIAKLHAALDIAMKKFADENGLVASSCRLSYSSTGFEVKQLRFDTTDSNPDAIDPRFLKDLKRNGFMYGLDESLIGRTMPSRRGTMTFQGMRASKAVFKCEADGKPYLYDAQMAAALIKKA
jgi:hypothetical protein